MYYEPVGPLGIASYVILAREIFTQLKELGITADYLFHTSGSGSTQAGTPSRREAFSDPPQGDRRYAQPPGYQGG